MPRSSLLSVLGIVGIAGVAACSTKGAAVRDIASNNLGCPSSAIRVSHVSGHIYRATGCGSSVEVACYDPYESTGAHKGWADGATAGGRSRCETLLNRPALTSAPAPSATPAGTAPADEAPAGDGGFDRALAARLLSAGADRARACARPSGPSGPGRVRLTFSPDGSITSADVEAPFKDTEVGRCVAHELARVSLPAFAGSPVTVTKRFDIPAAPPAGTTQL